MKRFFKKIKYRSPEITAALGFLVMYLSASSSDYGNLYGEGSPEWTIYGGLAGLALMGIGVFLGRVREEVNRAKKR